MFELTFNIPSFVGGAAVATVVCFFVANNNPEWISKTYRTMKAEYTAKIDEAQKQLAKVELAKTVADEVKKALADAKQLLR